MSRALGRACGSGDAAGGVAIHQNVPMAAPDGFIGTPRKCVGIRERGNTFAHYTKGCEKIPAHLGFYGVCAATWDYRAPFVLKGVAARCHNGTVETLQLMLY